MVDQAAANEIGQRIFLLLPDDPRLAVAILAPTFANVVCMTGYGDDSALDVVGIALEQIRRRRVLESGAPN